MSVATALRKRRSVRDFSGAAISLAEVGQVLWAAQGVTSRMGFRTAPSAGALYPLECRLVVGEVSSLPAAVYRYDPDAHELHRTAQGDRRAQLSEAALSQSWIGTAAVVVVLSAVERRTTAKYGKRGVRYVHIEAGHAAQNVYLQAAALGLGTTVVGAFQDDRVKAILALARGESPLCLLPVGRP